MVLLEPSNLKSAIFAGLSWSGSLMALLNNKKVNNMNTYIDYIAIILGMMVLALSVILFIRGKRTMSNSIAKYIPVLLVVASFLSVLLLNFIMNNNWLLKQIDLKVCKIKYYLKNMIVCH